MTTPTSSENGKRILLVEDEPLLAQALVSSFRQDTPHTIIHVSDGEAALTELRKSGNSIHLVLLDLKLPNVDGQTVLQEMRQMEYYDSVPVIVLTNLHLQNIEEECRNYPPIDFYVKARIEIKDVIERVEELFTS